LTQVLAFARLRIAGGSAKTAELGRQRRSGGIGRRAWFRSMYSQGCGGSSPPFGTNYFYSIYNQSFTNHQTPKERRNDVAGKKIKGRKRRIAVDTQ
jgi:hypothetical protein